MMKKTFLIVGFIIGFSCVMTSCGKKTDGETTSTEPEVLNQWFNGVYVNEDTESLIESITLCNDGVAYQDEMIKRSYRVEKHGEDIIVVLVTNYEMKLKISEDRKKLLPYDDFVKEWVTSTEMTLDESKTPCKN